MEITTHVKTLVKAAVKMSKLGLLCLLGPRIEIVVPPFAICLFATDHLEATSFSRFSVVVAA